MKNQKFLEDLKNIFIQLLKTEAVKAALKKFLGTVAGGGIKAWLIKYVVTELFEEIGEPAIEAAIVEGGYRVRKYQGGIVLRKLKAAKEEGNAENYDRSVDDILS